MGLAALIGQLFLTLAFSAGVPAKVSVIGLTQIVFAVVFDMFLFNRTMNALTLVGTLLVIAPTAWLLVQSRSATHGSQLIVSEIPAKEVEVKQTKVLARSFQPLPLVWHHNYSGSKAVVL